MNTVLAEEMAIELMEEHGLSDWRFSWIRAHGVAGLCNFDRETISLSKVITEACSVEVVRNTVLHEIAHALRGHSGTGKHGHDALWERIFKSIGGSGARSLQADDAIRAAVNGKAKYSTTCAHCGTEYHAHRRLKDFGRRLCGQPKCAGQKLNGNYLVWYENTKSGPVRVAA